MALTAALALDIKQFEKALDDAASELTDFDRRTKAIDRELAGFGESFSADTIAREAETASGALEEIGTAASGSLGGQHDLSQAVDETSQDLSEYAEAAGEAGKATKDASHWTDGFTEAATKFAAGFTIASLVEKAASAILDFGRQAVEGAGALVEMSAKTGTSIGQIQEFAFVADQTGTSVEAFAKASYNLGIAVAEGTGQARDAFADLGLSLQDLQQLEPEAMWDEVITALGDVESATERNRIGEEIFGRTWAEIAPAVAEGYKTIAKEATIAGDDQVKALERATGAWDAWKTNAISSIREFAGNVVLGSEALTRMGFVQRSVFQMQQVLGIKTLDDLVKIQKEYLENLEGATATEEEHAKRLRQRTAELNKNADILRVIALDEQEVAAAERALTREVEKSISAKERQNDALNKSNEAFRASITYFNEADTGLGNYVRTVNDSAAAINNAVTAVRNLNAGLNENGTLVSMSTQAYAAAEAEALKWAQTNGAVLAPSIQATGTVIKTETTKWYADITKTFQGIPNLIVSAFAGGGDVMKTIGSALGGSLATSLSSKVGDFLKGIGGSVLGPALGTAFNAIIPMVGSLLGPLLGKIGGFFKKLFGGPSADELAGRELVHKFEANVHAMLNDMQLLEAGNEDWKKTVIGIRDAYMAAGKTEAEALAAAERLWASSRSGAEASKAAIAEIEAVMRRSGQAAVGSINDISRAIDRIPRDVDINIEGHLDMPDIPESVGFQHGSGGLKDFGRGTLAVLHGRERVQTEAQMRAEQRGRIGVLTGAGSVAVAAPISVTINAQGAYLGDLNSQMRFRRMLSDVLMNEAELRGRVAPGGAY
jgi:hypothetical protein